MKNMVKITDPGRASCSCGREDCRDGVGTGSAAVVAEDGRAYFLPFMAKMGLSPYKEGQLLLVHEDDLFLTIKN